MNMPVVGIVPLVDAERESLWLLPAYMEGVKDVAPGLSGMAEALDGVAEAVWMPGNRKIFDAFVESMKKE